MKWRRFLHRLGFHWWREYDVNGWAHRKCLLCPRIEQWIPDCSAPNGGGDGWLGVDD